MSFLEIFIHVIQMSFRDNLSNDKVKHRHPRVFTSTSEMFTNHDKYLAERVEVESEDGEDFHP
jgi:hypothetical protein